MIKNDWQLTWQCTGYNFVMLDLVEQYKKERREWMTKGGMASEAALMTMTQTLWHSTNLEIQRLQKLGLAVTYKALQQIRYYKKDKAPNSYFEYRHDGRNLHCKVSQRIHMEKHFMREGRRIRKDKRDVTATFYITWASSPNGNYICPNCGRESILDTFLDGCDYCGSKFHIEAFKKKVASLYLTKSKHADTRSGNSNEAMQCMQRAGFSLVITFFVPIIFFITVPKFVVSFAKYIYLGVTNDINGSGRNTLTLLDIREYMPKFSVETFISSVDNKIKALHFAESEEDVKAFCLCSVDDVLRKYQKIALCENGTYVLKNFELEEEKGLYHIGLEMNLQLLELRKNKIKSRKEHIKLTFSKKTTSLIDTESDAQIFRCSQCGATVSLVEGGICKYCNKPIEMINHDWVITKYETNFK